MLITVYKTMPLFAQLNSIYPKAQPDKFHAAGCVAEHWDTRSFKALVKKLGIVHHLNFKPFHVVISQGPYNAVGI